MKRNMWLMLAVLLVFAMSTALAEPTQCMYYTEDSPCEIIWWVDTENRQHCRACKNHVTEKEDSYSHVPVTEWTDCTPDEGGVCSGCGYDYIKDTTGEDNMEAFMREAYALATNELGIAPVLVSVTDDSLTVKLASEFFQYLEAIGGYAGETMHVETKYTLTLPDGDVYAYTGEAITPEVEITRSEYGPGEWMEKYGLLTIAEAVYENNVEPGMATVKVEVTVEDSMATDLTRNFTITGGISGGDGGDSDDSGDDGAEAEYCMYGSEESPCDLVWWSSNKQHERYCTVHVTDKGDPYSYVIVVPQEPCSIDEETNICTVCGKDYNSSSGSGSGDAGEIPDEEKNMMLMEGFFYAYDIGGCAPVEVTVDGNVLTLRLTDVFFDCCMELGVEVSESMYVQTEYTLTLPEGDTYGYTGEAIKPEVEITRSEYGPGEWMEMMELLFIDDAAYANNVDVGTAEASALFTIVDMEYSIAKEFEITGGISGGDGGDSDDPGDDGAEAEYCMYGSEESPCDLVWWRANKEHERYCTVHVTDKGDPYSYVIVVPQEPCSIDEETNICTVCGKDYNSSSGGSGSGSGDAGEIPDEEKNMMLMEGFFYAYDIEGCAPVEVTVDGNVLTLRLTDVFFDCCMELGVEVSESMYAQTEYALTLPEGDTYGYTGEAITPEVEITRSDYGPGEWMEMMELLFIDDAAYANNVDVGTAEASALFTIVDMEYSIAKEFEITGEADDRFPGDADNSEAVTLTDAIAILQYLAGDPVAIDASNADVNGDGEVDLYDALRLLQYAAGWNVTLE